MASRTRTKTTPTPPPDAEEWGTLEDEDEYVNALWWGDGGTGKTTDLAYFAHLGTTIFIPVEPGLKKGPLQRLGVPLENLKIAKGFTYDDLDQLFWTIKGKLEDDPGCIKAVALDSGTKLHKMWLAEEVAKGVRKSEAKGIARDEFDSYQEDWGTMTEQIRKVVNQFVDLPCHFGMSALERRDVDNDGAVKYGPAVNPALQTDLFGMVDVVCRTYVEELRGWSDDGDLYLGSFRNVGKYRAKDRFKVMPKKMPNPTADRVVAYVQGKMDKHNDPDIGRLREMRANAGKGRKKPTEEDGEE